MEERIASLGEDGGEGALRGEPQGVEGQARPSAGKAVPTPGLQGACLGCFSTVRGSGSAPARGLLTAESTRSCRHWVWAEE